MAEKEWYFSVLDMDTDNVNYCSISYPSERAVRTAIKAFESVTDMMFLEKKRIQLFKEDDRPGWVLMETFDTRPLAWN